MTIHNNLTQKLISILILTSLASHYFLPKFGYIVLLVIFLSLIGLLSSNNTKKDFKKWEIAFIGLSVGYFLLQLFNIVYFDINVREIDNASRFILVLPIFLYLRKFGMNIRFLDFGLILACLTIGINSLFSTLYGETIIPIASTYGDSLYPGIFGICLLFFSTTTKEIKKKIAYLFPAVISLISALLAMGRGALIGSIIALIILTYLFFKKKFFYILIPVLLIAVLFTSLSLEGRFKKIEKTFSETISYFNDGEVIGSLGERYEMWKTALYIAKNNFYTGIGVTNYKKEKAKLIEIDKIDPAIERFNHPHSELLSSLVNQGIFGLVLLVLLLGLPILISIHSIKSKNESLMKIGIFLISIGVHYSCYSVGNAIFYHHHMTIFYVYFIAVGLGIYSSYSKPLE